MDRIHKRRGILTCFDFSATPFAPTGKASGEETLFRWIVSDFGLNDAIESGLVKTPRVVVRDDGQLTAEKKSKFYHLYVEPEVRDDLNRRAQEHEPLPSLVTQAYYFLGKDWLETRKTWQEANTKVPPVMITVANRTETAARISYAFTHHRIMIEELSDPDKILHIDSRVLEQAESRDEVPEEPPNPEDSSGDGEATVKKLSKADRAELLRRMVDTVGRPGELGGPIQKVISVGMLSEGWDAKTVTHIMGLRAFSSQLLCEQVVGRGLRRTSYEVDKGSGLFKPEYVNIFGVPFRFLPHEGEPETKPKPDIPPTLVFADPAKRQYEISWPNVIRIDHQFRTKLDLDTHRIKLLMIDALQTATLAELAPVVSGRPDLSKLTEIDLRALGEKFRLQKLVFEAAARTYDLMKPTWKGNRQYLLAQVIALVEKFMRSDRIFISPPLFSEDELRRRVVLALNIDTVVQHIWQEIRDENTQSLTAQFDRDYPIRSTGDMRPWGTRRPCEITKKSHINVCVFDSTWEASEAFELDRNANVTAWAKNDHLGFDIAYVHQGIVKKYRPDFLIKLANGPTLILEVKGQESSESKTKHGFLAEWVTAVNAHGGFGVWAWNVSRHPKDIRGILASHMRRVAKPPRHDTVPQN